MNLKAFLTMAQLAFSSWAGLCIDIGPEANLHQVVKDIPPGARATIVCHPGIYAIGTTNLFKNGVDWFGMPGAIISNRYPSAVFDNTSTGNSGAVTSSIYGSFELIDASVLSGALIRGVVSVDNAESQISFQCRTISNFDGDGDPAIVVITNGGVMRIEVERINWNAGGTALYWRNGNAIGRIGSIDCGTDGAIYCDGDGPGDWRMDIPYIESVREGAGAAGSVLFVPTSSRNKFWLRTTEIFGGSVAAGYGGCITVGGGKFYLDYQKMSAVEDVVTPRPLIMITNGESWLQGHKVTITNNQHFLEQTGGKLHWKNMDFEDAGWTDQSTNGRPFNMVQTGGTNWIEGGYAKTTCGPFYLLGGGTTYLRNLIVDTFSTLRSSNVCLWVTNTTPVGIIDRCTFIPGSLFSVSNSAAWDMRVRGTGGLSTKSNITATVTARGGTVVTDGTWFDR